MLNWLLSFPSTTRLQKSILVYTPASKFWGLWWWYDYTSLIECLLYLGFCKEQPAWSGGSEFYGSYSFLLLFYKHWLGVVESGAGSTLLLCVGFWLFCLEYRRTLQGKGNGIGDVYTLALMVYILISICEVRQERVEVEYNLLETKSRVTYLF